MENDLFQIYVNYYDRFSVCYKKMRFEDAIKDGYLFFTLEDIYYFRYDKGFIIDRCYKIRTKKVFERNLPYLSYEDYI